MLLQEAGDRVGVLAVQVQGDRRTGIGGAVEHRPGEPGLERCQEFHCLQRRLAGLAQGVAAVGLEQPPVFQQGLFDLGIGREGGFVAVAQALGRLPLGPRVVHRPAFGEQARGFPGDLQASLLHARVRGARAVAPVPVPGLRSGSAGRVAWHGVLHRTTGTACARPR